MIFDTHIHLNDKTIYENLDSLLKSAEEKGVKLEISGGLRQGTRISCDDLISLFSNLLDNALRAAADAEAKVISMQIHQSGNMLSLSIANHFHAQHGERDGIKYGLAEGGAHPGAEEEPQEGDLRELGGREAASEGAQEQRAEPALKEQGKRHREEGEEHLLPVDGEGQGVARVRKEKDKGELGKNEEGVFFPRHFAADAAEQEAAARKEHRLHGGREHRHPREGGGGGKEIARGGEKGVEPAGERGIQEGEGEGLSSRECEIQEHHAKEECAVFSRRFQRERGRYDGSFHKPPLAIFPPL